MFGFILISIITMIQLYVFLRAASVPLIKRHFSKKTTYGTGIILWVLYLAGWVFGHHKTGTISQILELFSMHWMAVLFLVFVCLFAIDTITAFGLFFPKKAAVLRGFAIITGVLLSIIAVVQGLRAPVVRHHEVQIPDLPEKMDGTVIVGLSDLHLGSMLGKRWLEALVSKVNGQHPDIVVLLGDFIEGHGQSSQSLDEFVSVLQKLNPKLGVWVVRGNHEFHGNGKNGLSLIKKAGFHLMDNRWEEVRPGFIMAGVDDLSANRRSGKNADLVSKALASLPPGATILLSHTPWETRKAARAGADLMLSGHTHGGQIWPFGYIVKRVYPFLAGRYDISGMTLIVCRGTGTWGPRMRLWHTGEILRIVLSR